MNKTILGLLVALLALGGVIWLNVLPRVTGTGEVSQISSSTVATTTTTFENEGIQVTAPQGAKVEIIPDPISKGQKIIPVPKIQRSIVFASDISPEARQKIQVRADEIAAILQKDSSNLFAWLDLGMLRQSAGDYAGAREAWNYVTAVDPGNIAGIMNLANLDALHLKNVPAAIMLYTKAISFSPKTPDIYRRMYDIYVSIGERTKSIDILKKGIASNPAAYELMVLLARDYRAHSEIQLATPVYEVAAKVAESVNAIAQAAAIREEAKQ